MAPVRPRVLVTGADLAPQAVAILADYEMVYAGKTPGEDDLVRLCHQHRPVAIVVRYGRIPERVMAASPELRVISKHGTGTDTIDVAAAKARGIAVTAAVGANAAAVAEHTWALIMACAKSIVPLDRRMRAGHWDKATHKSLELGGRTLGLVGLGAIGRRVAAAGRVFGMTVIAHDPFATVAPDGVSLVPLETLVATADVLSLHCPLTADNRNMIDRAALARMKDGVIVINTARGGLVDEAALAEALVSGKVRAAGLDSFQAEPMPSPHPFQGIDNLVLSPHIGGVTADAYVNMGVAAARNIVAALAPATNDRSAA
jgi:D-3-phosphoglycerate dehydrogenase